MDGALEDTVEEGPGEPGGGVMCVQTEQRTRALFTLGRSARSKAMGGTLPARWDFLKLEVEVDVDVGVNAEVGGGTEK